MGDKTALTTAPPLLMTSDRTGSQDIWVGGGWGGGGEEGYSSSLKGSPSGLFPLLIITRGLIIDWYIFKISEERGT